MTESIEDTSSNEIEEKYAPLRQSMRTTCAKLQSMYLSRKDKSGAVTARATLAKLRKNAAPTLADNPLALAEVLFVLEPALEPAALGKGDKASPSEEAAFAVLTMFGIHMQSATKPAHDPRTTFATACGQLHALKSLNSIKPRVDAMLLTTSEKARLHHIRSLITLMRDKQIAFDYGRLAEDLRSLSYPHRRNGVLLRWGRDFAYGSYSSTTPSKPQ